jgi:hypothetical protein
MASSGSAAQVFRVERWGRLKYAATIPLPRDRWAAAVDEGRMRPVRLGSFKSMLLEISPAFVDLVRFRHGAKWRAEARRFEEERAAAIRAAWDGRHDRGQDDPAQVVAGDDRSAVNVYNSAASDGEQEPRPATDGDSRG